mmetsp:Transcript_23118/g.74859  ORF Transcript_23118/g.74859 Transcript_23118/m.74859 type:complete len:525 (+) Transcript_23118:2948-4522(+)
MVRRQQRDANLGEDFEHTGLQRLARVDQRGGKRDVVELARLAHVDGLGRIVQVSNRLPEQVRVHRRGAVADEAGDVVGGPGLRRLHHDGGAHAEPRRNEVVVDRPHGEQWRDEDGVGVEAALLLVRQDHSLGTVLDRRLGLGAQPGDGRLEPRRAVGDSVQGGDRDQLLLASESRHLLAVKHGRGQREHVGQLLRRRERQVVPLADGHIQAHHDALAQRVNRRVGHLRKALLEVVVQRARRLGEHGQRRVVAHGEECLFAAVGHVAHLHLQVLRTPTKRRHLLHNVVRHRRARLDRKVVHRRDLGCLLLHPLAVGRLCSQLLLDFEVGAEDARLQVDCDHVARAEPALANHVLVLYFDHTSLGHEGDQPVLGLEEAGGAQPVTVERGAQLLAVAEGEQGGAVPRLLQPCVVVEHIRYVWVVVVLRLLVVRFRHKRRERERWGLAADADQVFEDGVEICRVGLGQGAQRVAPPALHVERPLPVDVADERIDLAIVRQGAHGLGQRPLGHGVGGEAAVVNCEVGRK